MYGLSMHKKILLILLMAFLLTCNICFARPCSAQMQASSDFIIPVKASLVINKLENVDGADQLFILHGTLMTRWTDTRLKNHHCTSPVSSKKLCVYTGHLVNVVFGKIWHPDLRLMNIANKSQYENKKLTISNEGNALYEIQFNAKIHSSLNLKNTPFYKQALFITLESSSWDNQHLLLQIGQIRFHDKKTQFIDRWTINHYSYKCILDKASGQQKSFYKCTIKLNLKCSSPYFIYRFIIPTIIFVLIGWFSFIVMPKDRITLSLSCLFALVIYEIYISNKLPNIYYITKIDLFFILGIISICLTILYHAIEAKRFRDEEKRQNKQLLHIPKPLSVYWRILIIAGYFIAALLILLL